MSFRKLHERMWRIENKAIRRTATVALFAFVQLPLHLLFWLCLPALMVFVVAWETIAGLWKGLKGMPRMIAAEITDWPRVMRAKRRTFLALWRLSESEWKANRPN